MHYILHTECLDYICIYHRAEDLQWIYLIKLEWPCVAWLIAECESQSHCVTSWMLHVIKLKTDFRFLSFEISGRDHCYNVSLSWKNYNDTIDKKKSLLPSTLKIGNPCCPGCLAPNVSSATSFSFFLKKVYCICTCYPKGLFLSRSACCLHKLGLTKANCCHQCLENRVCNY